MSIITVSDIRQAELEALPYKAYLLTPEWREIRKAALERQPRCQLCGSTTALQVHHNHYSRRGTETLSDLTVLCDSCHEAFHHRLSTTDPRLQGVRWILENEKSEEWVWTFEAYRAHLLEELSTT